MDVPLVQFICQIMPGEAQIDLESAVSEKMRCSQSKQFPDKHSRIFRSQYLSICSIFRVKSYKYQRLIFKMKINVNQKYLISPHACEL